MPHPVGPHAHPGVAATELSPEARAHQQRALRIMVLIVVPLAIWTLVAMVVLWPRNTADHIRGDSSSWAVAGVTMPVGTVTKVTPESCDDLPGAVPGVEATCASVEIRVDDGPEAGRLVTIRLNAPQYASGVDVGTKITMIRSPLPDGTGDYQFSEFHRSTPLIFFIALFVVVVVAVARFRGLMSLIGLGFAAVIITQFMFPALVSGGDPVIIGLTGSSAIMFVVLYTAHGFSTRTTTALLGTLFGLGVSAALGYIATRWAHLVGITGEEDYLLAASAPDLKLTSVVICGIIVAGLGVLNDVTITQASAVWELAGSGRYSARELFSSAMRIGRDHIASTVYTIAFATAGASLSTLLLLAIYQRPVWEVLQTELFATEVLRTVVGSVGLVLAMPLTTAIGAAAVALTRRTGSDAASSPTPDETAAPADAE